jgi:hypothetical protein
MLAVGREGAAPGLCFFCNLAKQLWQLSFVVSFFVSAGLAVSIFNFFEVASFW